MRKVKLVEDRNNNRHLDVIAYGKAQRFNRHCRNRNGSARRLAGTLIFFRCKIDNRPSRHPRHSEFFYLVIDLRDLWTRLSPTRIGGCDFLEVAIAGDSLAGKR